MSQHDMNIANGDGATVRADINSALEALAGLSSGASAPSTTFAYQLWADTTTGLLKVRNAANSAWVTIGTLGTAYLGSAQEIEVSKMGKQTIYVPASAITARTTNGAASGSVESSTNKVMLATLDFDASTVEYAQFQIRMPKSWNESTITATFTWTANSTSTNSVVWALQAVALSDDDAIDTAYGTAQSVTDANKSAAYDVNITAATSAITIGGTPAAEDWVTFQVYRNASDGSDTLAVDALLLGVTINYTTDAANDA